MAGGVLDDVGYPPKRQLPVVEASTEQGISVRTACRVLKLSERGFRPHRSVTRSSPRASERLISVPRLLRRPWVHAELTIGMVIASGVEQVRSIMKKIGTQAFQETRKRYTSKEHMIMHVDLVKRDFAAQRSNQLWCTDIAQHPTTWIPTIVATLVIERIPVKHLGARQGCPNQAISGVGC